MIVNLLFLISIFLLFCWQNVRKPHQYPPGPSWLPIIGNLPILKYLKIFKFHHLLWQYLAKIYGPIVGLRFLNDHIVIISGREAIKEFYGREEFNGRPDGFFFRVRSFDKRLGVVFTDGDLWEDQRKFAMKTLKHLGFGKVSMIQHIEHEAAELMEFFKKHDEIYMNNAFDISVLNIMWKMLGGERFDLEDEQLTSLMKTVHNSFRIIDMSGGILNQFPAVRFIIPDKSGYRPLVETLKPLWKFLKNAIQNIRDRLDDTTESTSFIEAYCKEIASKRGDLEFFSDEQLLALCVDFFQAGSETTSNTLGFGILYMLHNPDVMEKCQKEIDAVVSPNQLPKFNDRLNLRYTEAVICEIQRLANVAPLGIAHRAMETAKFRNYIIPKNTIVIPNIYSMHTDEIYWGDPFKFRPERFLDSTGNLIMHENFMPFGMGKRRCVGENLAKSSLFLFFSTFLRCFDISVPVGSKMPDLEAYDGITLSPKPFKVVLKQRVLN